MRHEVIAKSISGPDESNRGGTFSGHIFDTMRAHVAGTVSMVFAEHVERHRTDNWLLFSDYVFGDRNRPNDVIALTVAPGGDYWPQLLQDVTAIARSDFKDVRAVSNSMLELLSDPRVFTFCWILQPRRALTRNVAAVRGMLDRDIARLKGKPDVALRTNELSRIQGLRRKAESSSFNIRLFDNMIIAAALAAFVTYLISDSRRAKRVGWFSDRDNITAAHNAFAHHLYAVNVAQFSEILQPGWRGPDLGVSGYSDGAEFWADPFLRVPDHFAGMLSAWNFEQDTIPEKPVKYRQVLAEAVASHLNVHVMRLFFRHAGDLISADIQGLGITRKPASTA